MKLYCESCQRLGAPGRWSVIDGVLRIACATCGAEAELLPGVLRQEPVPAQASISASSAGPSSNRAAEIDRVLADFVATPGPSTAKSLAAEWELGVMEEEPAGAIDDDPWLAIGWARLQQTWHEPAAHKRLLAEAAARGDFAGLGAQYRDHLALHPDDLVAFAAREELIQKATAQLLLQQQEAGMRPAQARTLRNLILLVFLLGVLAYGVFFLLQMGGGA